MFAVKKIQQFPAPPAQAEPYRHDIDGLRAVAILLVVTYHVWVGRVSGGVDAFLMISAFFLTGSFVRRLERGKPLGIARQWVRTFKRLLPPAAVVLLATLVTSFFLFPGSRLPDLFKEIGASLFYSENWLLAFNSIDYYADKASASPVQHFWSLSVQGQVFLLWPLLFVLISLISNRTRLSVRGSAAAAFGAVFLASFAYSVITTQTRQEFAYFDTGARLWEFAAGALLAVAIPMIRAPRWARGALGWIGITALVTCGMLLDVQGGFPGYLALWPVLSVAAIIVAGTGGEKPPLVTRALAAKPVVMVGRDAYALYLVHWPMLIFSLQLKGGVALTVAEGLAVILLSMFLARGLTWLVDDRLRYSAWTNKSIWRGMVVITASVLLVAGPTMTLHWSLQQHEQSLRAELASMDPAATHPGAAALDAEANAIVPDRVPPIPFAGELDGEWGALPERCEDQFAMSFEEHGTACSYLPVEKPNLTVAVIGDSHAEQWLAPIEEIAVAHDWLTFSFLRGGCALALVDAESSSDPVHSASCNAWLSDVLSEVGTLEPDLVISVGTRSPVANEGEAKDYGENEHVPDGMEVALETLQQSGTPVVLIRDNPRFSFNAYECADALADGDRTIAATVGANQDCGVSRGKALAQENPADVLSQPGIATVDMTDRLCRAGSCPAIIGNVFVYLDDNHLTSTYAATMAPALEPRLLEAAQRAMSWE